MPQVLLDMKVLPLGRAMNPSDVPSGWKCASDIDLNAGSGGRFMYLLYRSMEISSQEGTPITDVGVYAIGQALLGNESVVVNSEASSQSYITHTSNGVTTVDGDLNRGAGGDYIYLYYAREAGVDPITGLTVLRGQGPAPEPFKKLDMDLNRNAGGEYLYLCYTKDTSYEWT
jgi:hypothetical protein